MNVRSNKYLLILTGILILIVLPLIILVALSFLKSSSSQQGSSSITPTSFPNGAPHTSVFPTRIPTSSFPAYQSAADKAYGDYWKNVDENYPWFNKFPIRTDSYFLYFDLNKKSFVANLYPQSNNSQSIDSQVAQMKQTIINQVASITHQQNSPIEYAIFAQ